MKSIKLLTLVLSIIVLSTVTSCSLDNKAEDKANDAISSEDKFTRTIPPAEFLAAFKAHPGALMVDVRTNKEYYAGTIIPNAINVDYHGDNFITEIVTLDRSQPVFIYCHSGGRSKKAAFKMRQLGIDKIYECEGGYARWQKEIAAQ